MAKEFEVFIPLRYNDGTKIEKRKIRRIKRDLLAFFEGATFSPHAQEGYWKMGAVIYQDEIVIFRAVTSKVKLARRFLKKTKEWLKLELRQEDIFILEKDVRTL